MEKIQEQPVQKIETRDLAKEAERVVLEFFRSIPGMEIRPATPLEDSGEKAIVKDLAIDAVGYLEGRPAIGLQITMVARKEARAEKTNDLLNRPFIRLSEMKTTDTAIPRSLVFVDGAEVFSFLNDHDLAKHPKLAEQILESNINSLKLDLMKTKNPKEQELIKKLLDLFEVKRKGTTN